MCSEGSLIAEDTDENVGPWSREQNNGSGAKLLLVEKNIVTDISLPHYALPCISSFLPEYANSEQDLVHRTFHTGNFDMLRHLPEYITTEEVMHAKRSRIDGVHTVAAPAVTSSTAKKYPAGKPCNLFGLFEEFEYIPSKYHLVDEIRSKERAESNALRTQISGKDFKRVGSVHKGKHEDGFEPGVPYPYLSDPYESMEESKLLEKWEHEAHNIHNPFIPSGCDKLPEAPTKIMHEETIKKLSCSLIQDWEGAGLHMYANDEGMWVICFDLSTVDSEPGLIAYMNIFIRCNSLVNKYQLVKIVENWGAKPGDGYIYFTVKPPWVHHDQVESFFTLHPEERSFKTIQAFKLLLSEEGQKSQLQNSVRILQ